MFSVANDLSNLAGAPIKMNYERIKENDVIYRCIGDDLNKGILSCGFMRKRTAERSQYNFMIGYYSCFLILQGSGRYITKAGEVISMQAGDLVQRFPAYMHSTEIEPDGDWIEFYISVGYPVYEYLTALGVIKTDKAVQHVRLKEDILCDFTTLLHTIKGTTDRMLPDMLIKAQEIILRLHRSVENEQIEQQYEEIIDKACQLIGSTNNIHYNMKEAAKAVNMGYENFRKIFKKRMGVSPGRYHVEQIMKQAKMMLISGVSIKQAALSLGYGDVYSFTKQFIKSQGISPGRYASSCIYNR